MIQVVKVSKTPAQIYGLNATPAVLLAAPPAGYVNNILGISAEMVFVAAAYTVAVQFSVRTINTGANEVFSDTNLLGSAGSLNLSFNKSAAPRSIFSTTSQLILTTDAVAATGDSPIDFYVLYEQKIIS